MSSAFDRAQRSYENMEPPSPPQCPDCGAELEDGVCPAAEETQAWKDEPNEYPEPEYQCEWVAPDEDGPDPDDERDKQREKEWDARRD